MAKVENSDFFKAKSSDVQKPKAEKNTAKKPAEAKQIVPGLNIRKSLMNTLKETSSVLASAGRQDAAAEIKEICKRGIRNRFSLAVVGEFSRGKSTFINRMVNKPVLPIGDMPTTALLTRIRYSPNERIVHLNEKNKKDAELPVAENSWDGLIAENFGKADPTGTVVVGLNVPWLKNYNVEIMDTPGAGDLEEKRAQIIGDALLGSDGAIITISATSALSLSEKLFIEQRLITRKVPFLMLIITKLDTVKKSERATVIEYIMQKLSSWGMDIPVFVPYSVEMDTDKYNDIVGMDKVRNRILSWVVAPERLKLTEEWLTGQALSVVDREISSMQEEQIILDIEDDKKREELIEQKRAKLKNAETFWEELRTKMLERCDRCYEQLANKVDEFSTVIIERLQYEASHNSSPSKWWKEDYSYRLKVELTNMASGVENTVSRIVSDDIRWFNATLEHNFNTSVLNDKESLYYKETLTNAISFKEIGFEDLEKKKNLIRIGTTVASISGYALCASIGWIPLIATMGISTGASILSDGLFKKKIESQRETIKQAIADEVPKIIAESAAESKQRINSIYKDVLDGAIEKEALWKKSQLSAIENSVKVKDSVQKEELYKNLASLKTLEEKLLSL